MIRGNGGTELDSRDDEEYAISPSPPQNVYANGRKEALNPEKATNGLQQARFARHDWDQV